MIPKNIELHIKELVLDGFDSSDRYRIGEAVEQELTRLFSEEGIPPGLAEGGEITSIDGGAIEVSRGSKAGTVGVQVAKSVYVGLRNERRGSNTEEQ